MDELIVIVLSSLIIGGLVLVTAFIYSLIGLWALPLIIYSGMAVGVYIMLILGTLGII